MKPHYDKQSNVLRKLVLSRFIASFIVYCLAMFGLYVVFESFISPAIGNVVAENTSHWEYISAKDVDSLWNNHRMIQFDTSSASTEEEPSYLKYRALDTYALLKSVKDDTLPILFILGIAGLIFYSLNKFVGYFAELSASVASLFEDKNTPIVLSKELKVVQNELQNIQKESLKNEQEAKEAERKKSELIAYIAHDLRTPLTSILGYSTLLNDKELDTAKQNAYLALIHTQAQKMNVMLDDFFEITHLNVSSFQLNKQIMDARTLCLQISDELYPQAHEKELTFEVKAPLNLAFYADPVYLARALTNIMRNAITYAVPKSAITLQADILSKPSHNSNTNRTSKPTNNSATKDPAISSASETINAPTKKIVLQISNKGKEISSEALPHIFDAFYREDSSRNSTRGGSGLGLAITQAIIAAHKGTVTAQSDGGITTFTITLPQEDMHDKYS